MKIRFATLSLTFALILITSTSFANHGPRIQFIHNVTATSAGTIDIWCKSANLPTAYLLHTGLSYKEATEFSEYGLIYGDLTFYITPSGSVDTAGYLFKDTFGQPQISYDSTHVIVLTGNSTNNFDMVLNDGRETAKIFFQTSINIFHGIIDAPAVNISEILIPLGSLVSNLKYKDSNGYNSFDPLDCVLQLQKTNGTAIADFFVPLSIFRGKALFIVATGYLDTTGIAPNIPFKLLLVQRDGTVIELNPLKKNGTLPRLQIIHNSASKGVAQVDVWITNGNRTTKVLSDFAYKEATPYIDAPNFFTISITASGSLDTTNAIVRKSFYLNQGESYVLVAAGEPGTNFDLFITDGLEIATKAGNTDVKIFHGSVGLPMVDIVEVSIPAGTIVNDLSFGQAKGFLNLAALDYNLQIKTQQSIGAAEFIAPLSAFKDSVLFVAATGYLDTTGPTPNNPFILLAVTPSGTVVELRPEASLTPARIQVIHNCAIPDANFVDVYIDDQKVLDDFEFRTSTPFIEVPGATQFTVDIDTKSSIDNSFPIYSESLVLESGRTYIILASGVIIFGSEKYFPPKEFDLIPIADTREASMIADKVDVMVFHGATDVPMIDVNELSKPVNELVDDLEYGMSQGYLELDPDVYDLEIALASTGTSVKTYPADLTSMAGQAITIVASGFLDPLKNNNGAEFGLWVSLPGGGDLIELKSNVSSVDENLIDNATTTLYPNPAKDFIILNYSLKDSSDVSIYLYDLNGMELKSTSFSNLQKSNHNAALNLDDLNTGLYIVKIEAGQTVITRKIQVNN
tara:strand:- start:235 stop:2631 length:2397 start_codon:yes stop_codon:yes gene_type:complete